VSYHWDAEEIDWAGEDALEIAGCADLGDAVERVEDADEADLFSVYVHRPAREPSASPTGTRWRPLSPSRSGSRPTVGA